MKYQSVIFFHGDKEPTTKEIIETVAEKFHETLDNFDKFNQIEIFTEDNKLGISDVRSINEWNAMKTEDKIKLSLIRQAEKLTVEAQNAILKVVEEPNENTLIVLSTNNIDSLLETVKSRCLIITFKQKENNNENSELVNTFLNSDFLQRSVILENLARENRAVIKDFLYILIKKTVENDGHNTKLVETIKASYIGIEMSTNTKLSLDVINIALLEKE